MKIVIAGILISITGLITNLFAIIFMNILLSNISLYISLLALMVVVFGFFKEIYKECVNDKENAQ